MENNKIITSLDSTINYSYFRNNLSSVMEQAVNNNEVILITKKNHKNCVLISEDEFNSIKETLYLISQQANIEHINQSINQANNNELIDY